METLPGVAKAAKEAGQKVRHDTLLIAYSCGGIEACAAVHHVHWC